MDMNKGRVVLRDLYKAECYLRFGYSFYVAESTIPRRHSLRYIEEMELEYVKSKHCYTGDFNKVWAFFTKNYGSALRNAKINSFEQLLDTANQNILQGGQLL